MEFHLLYSGPLHSDRSESSRTEKHEIRKAFHRQLRRLWQVHPNLRERAEGNGEIGITNDEASRMPKDQLFERGVRRIADNWSLSGFNFLPLVTSKLRLRSRLDILFLRNEERNYILQGGDIDRRLATLFDGLRIAREKSELPVGAIHDSGELPLFCLLENDDLISEVHVTTDRLLSIPGKAVLDQHDVYLQITVQLNTTVKVPHSWVFE